MDRQRFHKLGADVARRYLGGFMVRDMLTGKPRPITNLEMSAHLHWLQRQGQSVFQLPAVDDTGKAIPDE